MKDKRRDKAEIMQYRAEWSERHGDEREVMFFFLLGP